MMGKLKTSLLTVLLALPAAVSASAEVLTLPLDERPEWLARDGIVMAGSWEPLLFRVRRDGSPGYTPTPEQRAGYAREQSPEMIEQLKAMGVNFVMMHCYKGGGLEAEGESMADAVRFAARCREAGLRTGVYNYSGAFIWELFFKEMPQARDWLILDAKGEPLPYFHAKYRYFWNRNHPDAQTFYKGLIRFAIQEIQTDLIHFDNHDIGPGAEPVSAERFRLYLRDRFTAAELAEMGATDLAAVQPPVAGPAPDLLRRAWLDFASESLAAAYYDMGRYARTLRKDILVECNPGGVGDRIHPPVDHGRLLTGGEAFWDEGRPPGFRDGKLASRIRTYKIARRMDNIAFAYATTPLEAAESMAFNRDCLGCICWFEYGKIVAMPGSKEPVSPALPPYVRFFQTRRDLLRDTEVVADVAVLRSFPSQAFADPKHAQLTHSVEEAMIAHRVPFQIIYDRHLNDLKRYRVLVLAGCVAMSDRQIEQVYRYIQAGGRLCVIGPAATHDEWLRPRSKPGFSILPAAAVIEAAEDADPLASIREACGNRLGMSVDAPAGLCAELTAQANRRLVHLVSYRADGPVQNVRVRVFIPEGREVKSVLLARPDQQADEKLAFQVEDGIATFTVPAIEVYGIAVVNFQ